MKNFVLMAFLVFYVQVKIPAGMSRTYDNVKSFSMTSDGTYIRLVLANDKIAIVPTFFTIIEEK